MSKLRVAVLRGGPSDEYEVSFRTGSAVLSALNHPDFEPLDVIITKSGEWLQHGRTRYPEQIIPAVDVVFNALHGAYGEDGTLQRLLDRFNVPYTGSGAYASGIAMHKGFTKEHVRGLGFEIPQHVILTRTDPKTSKQHAGDIRSKFGRQYMIKPVSSGSSVGIQHVTDTLELANVIEEALAQYPEILVEEYIQGREVTCGVIERYRNKERYTLPPIEIIPPPTATYFSYDVKYDGTTREICPAPLPHAVKKSIENAASNVHAALGLRQYSRSDFILSPNGLYFLEVNTLPGLTEASLFPKALHAVGSSHQEFVRHLVHDALRTCV